jgi:hypothetical protein
MAYLMDFSAKERRLTMLRRISLTVGLVTTEFCKIEMELISLLREIKWSFRGIPCYAECPISCYEQNATKRNDIKSTSLRNKEKCYNFCPRRCLAYSSLCYTSPYLPL